jgi:hypothetical protein
MTWPERPREWSRAWLAMWAVVAAGLLASAVILPFRVWAIVATVAFGVPEAAALIRRGDAYPPLTYVTAYYLPRWLTVTLIGFGTGSIGAVWLGFGRPLALGGLLALYSWAISHFDVTYEEIW